MERNQSQARKHTCSTGVNREGQREDSHLCDLTKAVNYTSHVSPRSSFHSVCCVVMLKGVVRIY